MKTMTVNSSLRNPVMVLYTLNGLFEIFFLKENRTGEINRVSEMKVPEGYYYLINEGVIMGLSAAVKLE